LAVHIRLRRMGKKKHPYYRLVVTDSRSPRDGRFIEVVGIYHPLEKDPEKIVKVDSEKIKEWMSKGAKPSETVKTLLKKAKVI